MGVDDPRRVATLESNGAYGRVTVQPLRFVSGVLGAMRGWCGAFAKGAEGLSEEDVNSTALQATGLRDIATKIGARRIRPAYSS